MQTRIIIIDDHQLFREGVKRILDFEKDFEVVAEGGSYLHPKVTHSLVKEYRRLAAQGQSSSYPHEPIEIRRPLHLLTRRECEVLQLLADGKSNRGIGEALYISEKTVKNHVSNILQKMNVNDRTQAVVVAIKNGWVEVR